MKRLSLGFVLALLLVPVLAHAQALQNQALDPCALYPHQFAVVSGAVASPTIQLIAGAANKQTFVCGYHFSLAGSGTTSLTLSIGSKAAATPCASTTAPNGITVMVETIVSASVIDNSEGSDTTTKIGPIPIVPTSTAMTVDLCALTSVVGTVAGYVSYVQK